MSETQLIFTYWISIKCPLLYFYWKLYIIISFSLCAVIYIMNSSTIKHHLHSAAVKNRPTVCQSVLWSHPVPPEHINVWTLGTTKLQLKDISPGSHPPYWQESNNDFSRGLFPSAHIHQQLPWRREHANRLRGGRALRLLSTDALLESNNYAGANRLPLSSLGSITSSNKQVSVISSRHKHTHTHTNTHRHDYLIDCGEDNCIN